jgi:hypothetical protein
MQDALTWFRALRKTFANSSHPRRNPRVGCTRAGSLLFVLSATIDDVMRWSLVRNVSYNFSWIFGDPQGSRPSLQSTSQSGIKAKARRRLEGASQGRARCRERLSILAESFSLTSLFERRR